ncbi:DUF6916 family protein [Hahella ganghwensis]|uniref:DUF6916 family protein n=1 Tax=Hahella ganghwensis TaxID=286420 RepID=UPI00035E3E70|nr:hypothetical protein [Hahella ganghwensis]
MENFNKSLLSEIVDQKVKLQIPEGSDVELTVSKVGACALDGDEWESFYVYLKGDESFHLPQGTYPITHEAFGTQDLFLSPKSPTEYEIIVNRKR